MIFAVDVGYQADTALAAGVLSDRWSAPQPTAEFIRPMSAVADYAPGEFYKRELPCILALLQQLPAQDFPQYIVIDGYVDLGNPAKPGLGQHLYNALQGQAIVIGVAKTRFQDTPKTAEVCRGNSQRPLYVTAIGIEVVQAQQFIQQMHGDHRIPTLLKWVDRLSRSAHSIQSPAHSIQSS